MERLLIYSEQLMRVLGIWLRELACILIGLVLKAVLRLDGAWLLTWPRPAAGLVPARYPTPTIYELDARSRSTTCRQSA